MDYVDPEKEEKPVTTNKRYQDADVPQDREDNRRMRVCWIDAYHHDGRDQIEHEAIEHQDMRNPSVPVAEFAESCDVMHEGAGRDGDHIRGAELQLCGSLCSLPLLHLSLIHISEPTRLGMISYAVFC